MAPANDKSASKKPKLVRDSFTIPKNEFAAIETLKARAIALGTSVKKSELLRAGLMALQGLSDAAYKAAVAAVPTLKTGRPAAKPVAAPVEKKAAAKKPTAKKAATTKAAKPTAKAAPKAPAKPAAKPARKAPAKKAAPRKAPATKTA
ncbi:MULTISPECIES: hypothetical protein [Hydrogenophaga]|jgi:outer membrane biosynthesis protein TonB|uniref:Uncharacterized protein n=1 Tax=Hydrogenophaga intermedia TaxID=65786 RepID=A0A1L1PGF6_HYDIT|nr:MULTISPECIES: hypothetical protein [Hydrogenophaga]AOS78881.1 hypothetical protein Q5W_07870 [Hydrogenophaga sp. PBC]CDN87073.1 hypothetical protein BN948_01492 [Hydrogenophaga intermedia]